MSLLGENAAELLLEKISTNNEFSKKINLNNKLVIREKVKEWIIHN